MKITLFTNHSGGNAAIKMSGIGRYSSSLCDVLKKAKEYEVRLAEPTTPPAIIKCIGKIIGKDMETVWRSTPFFFPETKEDELLHCTAQTLALPLLFSKRKCVVTVHDIIPLATKEYANVVERITYFLLKYALKRAVHIIADSEHTKEDIIKHIRYPSKKITVIPLGIDQNIFKEKKTKRERNIILYVGSDAKRKNIELIIKALVHIKKEIPDIIFVKVGQAQDNAMRKKLKMLAKDLSLEQHVVWKDYVEDLTEEYNKATIFVFPSLYEGFGFPILEAMACGCPVICSNKTSLPELGEDAVIYTDAMDQKDLAQKIIILIKDKMLQEQLRKKGKQQVQKFTWESCAEKIIRVYNGI